jgi:hypothetical protein
MRELYIFQIVYSQGAFLFQVGNTTAWIAIALHFLGFVVVATLVVVLGFIFLLVVIRIVGAVYYQPQSANPIRLQWDLMLFDAELQFEFNKMMIDWAEKQGLDTSGLREKLDRYKQFKEQRAETLLGKI